MERGVQVHSKVMYIRVHYNLSYKISMNVVLIMVVVDIFAPILKEALNVLVELATH